MKNKKQIWFYLNKHGITHKNSCKLLDNCMPNFWESKRGHRYVYNPGRSYFWYFRDRHEDQAYYLVKLKGNYIKAYVTKYCYSDGKGVNTFCDLFIPTLAGEEIRELPRTIKKLILKIPLNEYKEFIPKFRELTPYLEWFDEGEKDDE